MCLAASFFPIVFVVLDFDRNGLNSMSPRTVAQPSQPPKRRGRPPKQQQNTSPPVASSGKPTTQRRSANNGLASAAPPLSAVTGEGSALTSQANLQRLIADAEAELKALEPQIAELEKQQAQLRLFKTQQQRLISLKLSLSAILEGFLEADAMGGFVAVVAPSAAAPSSVPQKPATPMPTTSSSASSTARRVAPSGVTSPPPSEEPTAPRRRGRPAKAKVVPGQAGKPPKSQPPADLPDGPFVPDLAFEQSKTIIKRRESVNYEILKAIVLNGGYASSEEVRHYLVENDVRQPSNDQPFTNAPLTSISSRINYLVRKGLVRPANGGLFVTTVGWANGNRNAVKPSHAAAGSDQEQASARELAAV